MTLPLIHFRITHGDVMWFLFCVDLVVIVIGVWVGLLLREVLKQKAPIELLTQRYETAQESLNQAMSRWDNEFTSWEKWYEITHARFEEYYESLVERTG